MTRQMPPIHPAADLYPLMGDEELADLAANIKGHGQRIPILMTDGAILDGRNRWRACAVAEVEPLTVEWDKKGDPLEVVESLNERRRHLTPTQRAAIAAARVAYFEREAKERQTAGLKKGAEGPVRDESTLTGKQDESARSVARAAKKEGAGVSATKALKAIRDKAPEIHELARDGRVNTEEAKRAAALPEPERKEAIEKIRAGKKAKEVLPRAPKKAKEAPRTTRAQDDAPDYEAGDAGPVDTDPVYRREESPPGGYKPLFGDGPGQEIAGKATVAEEIVQADELGEQIRHLCGEYVRRFPNLIERLGQLLMGQMSIVSAETKKRRSS